MYEINELTLQFERLANLHESGAVSDGEFIEQSKRLLGSDTTNDTRPGKESTAEQSEELGKGSVQAGEDTKKGPQKLNVEANRWAQLDDQDWWYKDYDYYPTGPVKAKQIIDMLSSGDVHENTSVWCTDLKDWTPLCQVYQPIPPESAGPGSLVDSDLLKVGVGTNAKQSGPETKTVHVGASHKGIAYAVVGIAVFAFVGWLVLANLDRQTLNRLSLASGFWQTKATVLTPSVDRSKLCKTSAASKWLLDFSFYHAKPTLEQTLEMIKQVAIYAEAIRHFCNDNQINSEIKQAAQLGTKPKWIEGDIASLEGQIGRRL